MHEMNDACLCSCKCNAIKELNTWGVTRMLQVFQLFRTYVASVLFGCCKNRSDVAHIAMCVRNGGGVSSPCARFGDAGRAWAREMQAWVEACWPERGKRECNVGVRLG
jgi:hypothetical protein